MNQRYLGLPHYTVMLLLPLLALLPDDALASTEIQLQNFTGHWAGWLAVGIFVTGFLGLAISTYPNIIPYAITIREAAAANNSLALMLVGVVIMLPVILGYTAYVYWIFRGKASADATYH